MLCAAAVWGGAPDRSAGPAAAGFNRALELDGRGAFLELPAAVWKGLKEATFEVWVRLDPQGSWKINPILTYEGPDGRLVWAAGGGNALFFHIGLRERGERCRCGFANALTPERWTHVAASAGPQGLALYLDGVLVATNPAPADLSMLGEGGRLRLGAGAVFGRREAFLKGRVDCLRVWSVARDREAIRRDMLRRLRGDERGLRARWDFDRDPPEEASTGGFAGRLVGGARTVPAALPSPETFVVPTLFVGQALGKEGKRLSPVVVQLRRAGRDLRTVIVDQLGRYGLTWPIPPGDEARYDLVAFSPEGEGRTGRLVFRRGAVNRVDLRIRPLPSRTQALERFRSALLEGLRQDPTMVLRLDPSWALRLNLERGMAEAMPALLFLARSSDPKQRRAAVYLLGRLGQSTVQVVETLGAAAHSEDGMTRLLAVLALRQLDVPRPLRGIYEKRSLALAYLFVGLLIPLALIHLWLYFVHPAERTNIHYSAFTLAAAGLAWILGSGAFGAAGAIAGVLLFLSLGLRLLYALFAPRVPLTMWVLGGLAAATIGGVVWIADDIQALVIGTLPPARLAPSLSNPLVVTLTLTLFLLVFMPLEMVRALAAAVWRRKPGAWLVACGFLALLLSALMWPGMHALLASGRISAATFNRWIHLFPSAGIAIFAFTASGQLAWAFARMHHNLGQVKAELETRSLQLAAAKTAAEKACEEAKLASESKSRFLAGMSHELRTPLNAIIGYSEMLEEQAQEAGMKEWAADLRKIRLAARHQLALINEVLDISKIEAGRVTLHLEEFDVCALARETAATVEPLARRNHNVIQVDCPPEAGRMFADPVKLRQILYNLLSNACKFTENGRVTFRVRRRAASSPEEPDRLIFTVTDTGPGLPEDQLERIFEAFTQLPGPAARKQGGTGLGLTISRSYCRLMGGELTASSKPGEGASFTAVLPARVRPVREKETLAPGRRLSPDGAPPARTDSSSSP